MFLAGESVQFDAQFRPQFTAHQVEAISEATREGLARWTATEHGRKVIALLNRPEFQITVTEDAAEDGIGRAPQPGIATLLAASDHAKPKVYDVILNPAPLTNQPPAMRARVMALAWAGEMLHIDFYARGISLPHHPREDFQDAWQAVAAELGMPAARHEDSEHAP